MSDKERLAEAEALLRAVDNCVYSMGITEKIKQFLNPEPEIDWDEVPIGTQLRAKEYGTKCHYTKSASSYDSYYEIPPQASHIHKCPWPEDGKKPDWVEGSDFVWVKDRNDHMYGPYLAKQINWVADSKWFAVLKPTSYRRVLE